MFFNCKLIVLIVTVSLIGGDVHANIEKRNLVFCLIREGAKSTFFLGVGYVIFKKFRASIQSILGGYNNIFYILGGVQESLAIF